MKPGFASVSAGSVPPGVLALFSCKEGQRSYESDKLENGVFFHFVIEAFQGKANTSNGQLMRHDLDKHLTEHVDQYVHDVLKLDEHQLWQFRGESDRNLPLADVESPNVPEPKGGTAGDCGFQIQCQGRSRSG